MVRTALASLLRFSLQMLQAVTSFWEGKESPGTCQSAALNHKTSEMEGMLEVP